MLFPMGYRRISPLAPGAPPTLPSLTSVPSELLLSLNSHFSHLWYNCSCSFLFLNMLSKRHCHHPWWAQLWPVACLSRSCLMLALSDTGKPSCSFLQKPPLWCLLSLLIPKNFLCKSVQEGLRSLSRILHSWGTVLDVQCLLRTIWMMFYRSTPRVYCICFTYLACTTVALYPWRTQDDLPTVFSGVEQDMNTWHEEYYCSSSTAAMLCFLIYLIAGVQHFQVIWKCQHRTININAARDGMICCYHTRNGILKLILLNQFYCNFYYSSLNNELVINRKIHLICFKSPSKNKEVSIYIKFKFSRFNEGS